jgi:predicted transcriptional regulator
MSEKKAVLNVTVAESLADAVRQSAAARGTTISSVVEAALAEQIKWDTIRLDGLAAAREEYEETGHYPTPEELAAAKAQVDEEMRLLAEARAAMAAERGQRDAGAA